MSGMKNKVLLMEEMTQAGVYKSSKSKVNFAVSNRNVLDNLKYPIDASVPKALTKMIDIVSKNDPKQTDSYKVCVDGKKKNSGTFGQKLCDVNLWGFESSPSLDESVELYNDDIKVLNESQDRLVLFPIQELKNVLQNAPKIKTNVYLLT